MTGKLIAFVLGVCALLLIPELPPFPAVALLLSALAGLWLWRHPAVFFVLGFAFAFWRVEQVLEHTLPPALEGETVVLSGQVVALPMRTPTRLRFRFRVQEMADTRAWQGLLLLSWYNEAAPTLLPGEWWQLHVRLKQPHGMANQGGFDYEAWLLQNHIRATGYVREHPGNIRIAPARGRYPDRLRQRCLEALKTVLQGHPQAALIYALTLGERGHISAAQWQTLRRTGTTHLLAISGLHIGMIALLAIWASRLLWLAWPGPRPAAPRFALYAALPSACLYALLAGFTLPTQRALVMLLILSLGSLAGRRIPASITLLLALTAVLLLDPLAPLSAGFWLSFGMVSMLVFGLASRPTRHAGLWRRWGRAQWLASLILLPLMAAWFRQYPLLSLPCNLLAVPWVGFISLPLSLVGLLLLPVWNSGAVLVLDMAGFSLDILWRLLSSSAAWGLLLELPQPPLLALLLGSLCALLLSLPGGALPTLPLLAGVLTLLMPATARPAHGDLYLTLLDAGQGLAVVARTRRHVLVYDTGATLSEQLSVAEAVLLPYLSALGVRRPDRLIISHSDNDHAGGLAAVQARYPGLQPISGEAERLPGARPCLDGQAWSWDGVRFAFLHPDSTVHPRSNDRSCVLRITAHGRSVLLPGDIEETAEYALLRRHGHRLGATVLVIPHHGSRTSSSLRFVDAVRPDLVLVPVGYRNRFGFPKADIIERYTRLGGRILSTVETGMIEVRLQRAGMYVSAHRWQRRWWRHQPAGS